jgi:hypothetical protein
LGVNNSFWRFSRKATVSVPSECFDRLKEIIRVSYIKGEEKDIVNARNFVAKGCNER